MESIMIELFFIFLLIFVNGLFASAEIAIVSARKARLEQMAKEGSEGAKAAIALTENSNVFLATIQIGITSTAILTGVFGGATLADPLAGVLGLVPFLKPYASQIAFTTVVIVISYLTLILGELAPKQVAMAHAEKLACIFAPPMLWLSRVAHPVVLFLNVSTDVIVSALRIKSSKEPPVTQDEIKLMIEDGRQAGVFQASEENMVNAVLRLGNRRVTSIMTPRPKLIWLDIEQKHSDILAKLPENPPNRLLVADGNLDHLLGFVHTRQIVAAGATDKTFKLRSHLQQLVIVPETKTALQLLDVFKKSGTHIAVVLDEYGSVQGLVTMTDLLESIVGEIGPKETTLGKTAGGQHCFWVLDGITSIDRLKTTIGVDKLPQDDDGSYNTLAGFIMFQAGKIPQIKDKFEWAGFCFQVLEMKGNRVERVSITPTDELLNKRLQDDILAAEKAREEQESRPKVSNK